MSILEHMTWDELRYLEISVFGFDLYCQTEEGQKFKGHKAGPVMSDYAINNLGSKRLQAYRQYRNEKWKASLPAFEKAFKTFNSWRKELGWAFPKNAQNAAR